MKLIGKGAFTRAYLKDNRTVLLKSRDPIKDCMASGFFPECKLFPKVTRVDLNTYEMKYYPRTTSLKNNLKPRQWEYYKQLRKAFNNIVLVSSNSMCYLDRLLSYISYKYLREAIAEAYWACRNYGRVCFEISPRNVAVHKGNLVLLDVFFNPDALYK